MIKVNNSIGIYEDNGKRVVVCDKKLVVNSHGLDRDLVVVSLGKETVTVAARDLIAAVTNSQNTAR